MSIILIVLLILIFLHIKYNKKTNDDYHILQIDSPSKTVLEETLNKKQPTVILNVGSQWKELMALTPEYIKRNCADYSIYLQTSIKEQQRTKIIKTTLGEYIEWIANNNNNTNHENRYISNNKSFLRDYGLVDKLDNYINPPLLVLKEHSFSMGPAGTKVGLHYDKTYRNILYQIYGKTKIILFSPANTKYLYKSGRYDGSSVVSKIDFWNQDLDAFPLFNKAQFIEIILYPGQLLYIPSYWWYATENIDTCITISIKTENIFSSIEKVPEVIKSLYHLNGLYKKNNCTCHSV